MALSLPSPILLVIVFFTAEVTLCAGNTPQNSWFRLHLSQCWYPLLLFARWGKNTFLWLLVHLGSNECVARHFGHDSVVCECNATYCDSVGSLTLPPLGWYSSYLTTMAGSRLEAGQGQVQVNSTRAGEWCELLLGCLWCWSRCKALTFFFFHVSL